VTKYLSITNHMWSGFNLLANLKFWQGLPSDVQAVVDRNVRKYVAEQRAYTNDLNSTLAMKLAERGLVVNTADGASFRRKLGTNFYHHWRNQLGSVAWGLLEEVTGRLI
jgi:TRAP-type C4-dicarboxylate transport system substrate-binding protein